MTEINKPDISDTSLGAHAAESADSSTDISPKSPVNGEKSANSANNSQNKQPPTGQSDLIQAAGLIKGNTLHIMKSLAASLLSQKIGTIAISPDDPILRQYIKLDNAAAHLGTALHDQGD